MGRSRRVKVRESHLGQIFGTARLRIQLVYRLPVLVYFDNILYFQGCPNSTWNIEYIFLYQVREKDIDLFI